VNLISNVYAEVHTRTLMDLLDNFHTNVNFTHAKISAKPCSFGRHFWLNFALQTNN